MYTEENLYTFCALMAVLYMIGINSAKNNEFNIAVNKAKMSEAVEQICTMGPQYQGQWYYIYLIVSSSISSFVKLLSYISVSAVLIDIVYFLQNMNKVY